MTLVTAERADWTAKPAPRLASAAPWYIQVRKPYNLFSYRIMYEPMSCTTRARATPQGPQGAHGAARAGQPAGRGQGARHTHAHSNATRNLNDSIRARPQARGYGRVRRVTACVSARPLCSEALCPLHSPLCTCTQCRVLCDAPSPRPSPVVSRVSRGRWVSALDSLSRARNINPFVWVHFRAPYIC